MNSPLRKLAPRPEVLMIGGTGGSMYDQARLDSSNRQVHVLRFVSLFNPGRVLVVPCDERGQVNLDSLTERMRLTYLGARAMVGREYAYPVVEPPL